MRGIWQGEKRWPRELAHESRRLPCSSGEANARLRTVFKTYLLRIATQADNNDWTLHIGTEDGEILNSRAENDDWFPSRLKNKVDFYQSISEMKQNGFVTKIPDLNKGEKIHIQYLTAYDKKDEQKVNTWLAVDEFKRKLENWIGIW